MPRPTYHQQVRKQKERARKARQEEKQQRRATRVNTEGDPSGDAGPTDSEAPREPHSETSS